MSEARLGEPAGKAAFTDTVVLPLGSVTAAWSPSVSLSVSTVRTMPVGLTSLSAMDSDAPVMVKPAADPDTATVSAPSPATVSSAGVKVKVPIPLAAPAAMVTVNEGTAVKSAEEAVPPDTDTDTAVAVFKTGDPFGKEAVTSTIVAPLPSLTLAGFRVRVIPVGGVSLSVIVIEALFTAVKPAAAVVPDTVSASSPSARLSSVRVRVKVPAPED